MVSGEGKGGGGGAESYYVVKKGWKVQMRPKCSTQKERARGLEYNLPYVPFSFEHILSDENPRFYFSPLPPHP